MEPDLERGFEGGVRSRELEGRRVPVRIVCGPTSLRATASDGRTFELPYHALEVEVGGATGRMVFCRDPSRSLTIFSEAKGFEAELRESSRGLLAGAFTDISARRRARRRRFLLAALAVIGIVVLAVFAARPIIRLAVATLLPYGVDEAIGKAAFSSMDKGGPVVANETVRGALEEIVERLQPHAAIPEAEFRIEVVESEVVNAYALPGGYMVVFTGLIEQAERPEEVAGVLAHEMAHVTLRHGLQRVAQAGALVVLVDALLGDLSGLAALAVELFTWQSINSYSRGSEQEADLEGARMLHEAGIDPSGLSDFFRRLSEEDGAAVDVPVWLSSHPGHDERIAAIRERLSRIEKAEYEALDIDWDAVKASLR